MAFYMTQFSYTADAWSALVKKPEDRSAPVKALMEKLGGKLLQFYCCFGEYDGLVIYEAPDDTTAATAVLAAIAPGHLKATKTTTLLPVNEAMKAMGKAGEIAYPAPKG
ncbi:MAG: GYD domain-containing protein [Dehalococcoidia bacterium]